MEGAPRTVLPLHEAVRKRLKQAQLTGRDKKMEKHGVYCSTTSVGHTSFWATLAVKLLVLAMDAMDRERREQSQNGGCPALARDATPPGPKRISFDKPLLTWF